MGEPMAARLLTIAQQLTVYNRTPARTAALQAQGATVANTVADVFAQSDVVVLMLTDADAITSLLFTPALLAPACAEPAIPFAGRTIIQMGTIAPQESQTLHDRITSQGGEYLEAPVLGSIPEAKSGNLIVMVGATLPQFEQWRSLLETFGPNPTLVGPVGTGAAVKLALNQLIGALTTAFGLSLALTQNAGVDPEVFMSILRQSALYAPTFDKKLVRMLEQNYANPNFPAKHLLKDMNLFSQAAAGQGLPTEVTTAIAQLLQQTIIAGLADGDYSALYRQIQPQ
ncbi:MAG: NAD(P)-dependent oxidoreductase [Alkalinema sp. RL_2_19]|nr:NAD(P)-dependent oxidoreductase [Alkalinema sp. RL_2_19]